MARQGTARGGRGGFRRQRGTHNGRARAKAPKLPPTNTKIDEKSIFGYLLVSVALFSLVMLLLLFQKQPEKYSAIALMEKTLPMEMEANETFTFGFDILNREGNDGLYSYGILVDGKKEFGKKAALASGERKTIYEALKIGKMGRHTVTISLELENGEKYDVFFKIDIV